MRLAFLIAVSAAALAAGCQNNAEDSAAANSPDAMAAEEVGTAAAADGSGSTPGMASATQAGSALERGDTGSGSSSSRGAGSARGGEIVSSEGSRRLQQGTSAPSATAGSADRGGSLTSDNMTDTERRLNPQPNSGG